MLSRKEIWRYIFHQIELNGGKMLDYKSSGGCYYWYERDREKNMAYFQTQIRGNRIFTKRIRYLVDGEAVNAFMHFIPAYLGGEAEEPEAEELVILSMPISKYKEYPAAYKKAASSLGFYYE